MKIDLTKNQIDLNDWKYIEERYGLVMESEPCPTDSVTGKINPTISRFKVLGKPNDTITVAHVKPIYYETREGAWRPLYEVSNHYGNKRITFEYEKLDSIHPDFLKWIISRQKLFTDGIVEITSPYSSEMKYPLTDEVGKRGVATISFTTTTKYPDANPETTTCDGVVRAENTATYALAHDAATGTSASDTVASDAFITNYKVSSSSWYVRRAFFGFDVTSVGSDTMSAVVFSICGSGDNFENVDSDGIEIVSGSPASNTALSTADFDAIGSTSYATKLLSTWDKTINVYNDFSLSGAGITYVDGWSSVGFLVTRSTKDLSNTAPTGGNACNCLYADTASTTSDPKLVITHSAGGGIIPSMATLGVGA